MILDLEDADVSKTVASSVSETNASSKDYTSLAQATPSQVPPPQGPAPFKQILHMRLEFSVWPGRPMFPPRVLNCWFEGANYDFKKKEKPKTAVTEAKISQTEEY